MGTCMLDVRPFPIQQERGDWTTDGHCNPGRSTIPWWLAEIAYSVYSRKYGNGQTLERLAERGGFGRAELMWLLRGGEDGANENAVWDKIHKEISEIHIVAHINAKESVR